MPRHSDARRIFAGARSLNFIPPGPCRTAPWPRATSAFFFYLARRHIDRTLCQASAIEISMKTSGSSCDTSITRRNDAPPTPPLPSLACATPELRLRVDKPPLLISSSPPPPLGNKLTPERIAHFQRGDVSPRFGRDFLFWNVLGNSRNN